MGFVLPTRPDRRRPLRAGLVVLLLLGTAVVVAPAAAAGGVAAATAGGDRHRPAGLTIVSPRDDSTLATRSLDAAGAVSTPAVVRLGGRTVASARLNGHPVELRGTRGTATARLSAANGLRPGVNRLVIISSGPGRPAGQTTVSQFLVTYPADGLIDQAWEGALRADTVPTARVGLPSSGISALTARLNGTDVTDRLLAGEPLEGGRRVELGTLPGLRPGRNLAEITVTMDDGRTQTDRRAFVIDQRHALPLVSLAGQALTGAPTFNQAFVGQAAVLDAGASRPARGRLRDADVRWSLVEKPPTSGLSVAGSGRTYALTPDVPGYYRIRVTVGTGPAAASAVITVSATSPTLLLPFDVQDPAQGSALVVGAQSYAVTDDVQVTILNRSNLGPATGLPSGLPYTKGYPATTAGLNQLGTDLASLGTDDTKFVVVSNPPGRTAAAGASLSSLQTALGHIGGAYPQEWALNLPGCWTGATNYCFTDTTGWVHQGTVAGAFSLIGVPGMAAGQAWRATAAQGGAELGRLKGDLVTGTPTETGGVSSYVVVAGDEQYTQVQTCANVPGVGDCVIAVGDQTYAPTPGVNGWNVVVLDRTTLQVLNHQTVATGGQLNNAMIGRYPFVTGRTMMPPALINDQQVIIVQSVGTGQFSPANADLAMLDQYGGTPELAVQSMTNGTPYALVGVPDTLPWHGTAVESSPLAGARQNGRLVADLARGRDWTVHPISGDPQGGDPDSGINLGLYPVIYQDPTDWPWAGDPSVAVIGTYLSIHTDVRSSYPNTNEDFGSLSGRLAAWDCPSNPPTAGDPASCGSNFAAVKQQLLAEFGWVENTRALATNLSTPFAASSTVEELNIQDVYTAVQNSIPRPPPPTASSSFNVLDMFVDVSSLASSIAAVAEIGDSGAALGLLSAAGEMATYAQTDASGNPKAVLRGQIQQIEKQLATSQEGYLDSLDRLAGILVSDYGKLHTVGVATGTDDAWSWQEGSSLQDSYTAINASTIAQSYASMLPLAWPVWDLRPDYDTQMSSADLTTFKCVGNIIWGDALPGNVMPAADGTNQSGVVWENWTFSLIDKGQFNAGDPAGATTLPTVDLTQQLTSVNSGPIDGGGFQNKAQWLRRTYNPPSRVECGYIPGKVGIVFAGDPPVIANADAARNG